MRRALIVATSAAALIAAPGGLAQAQAVAPMRLNVGSLTDQYVIRLDVSNPYAEARRFRITAFDPDGQPIEHWTDSASFDLAPAARKRITLAARFDGAQSKDIYVCAETRIEGPTGAVRGQVCSHVSASRLESSR